MCRKPRVPRWRLHMCVWEAARSSLEAAHVCVGSRAPRQNSSCHCRVARASFTVSPTKLAIVFAKLHVEVAVAGWSRSWQMPHRLPLGELTLSRMLSPAATTQSASRRTRATQSRDCSVVCRRATGHCARNYTVCCAGTALKQGAGRQKIVFSHLVSFRVAPPVTCTCGTPSRTPSSSQATRRLSTRQRIPKRRVVRWSVACGGDGGLYSTQSPSCDRHRDGRKVTTQGCVSGRLAKAARVSPATFFWCFTIQVRVGFLLASRS